MAGGGSGDGFENGDVEDAQSSIHCCDLGLVSDGTGDVLILDTYNSSPRLLGTDLLMVREVAS